MTNPASPAAVTPERIAETRGLANCVSLIAADRVREVFALLDAQGLELAWMRKERDMAREDAKTDREAFRNLSEIATANILTAEYKVADYERLFDMQHKRTRVADEAWRQAHPGNELVLPDLGTLIDWLMARADAAEVRLAQANKALEEVAEMFDTAAHRALSNTERLNMEDCAKAIRSKVSP